MDDISDKIQNILNDEESMKQIKELAEMFTSSQAADGKNNTGMPDLSSLASMFSGMGASTGGEPQNSEPGLDIDMGAMMNIAQAIGAANKSDKNTQFLAALRPLMKEDKQQKIDKAIKLLKLYAIYTALKESGALKNLDSLL